MGFVRDGTLPAGPIGETMPDAVAALIAWKPDVIVAMGASDAKPLLARTRTIPIVVVTAGNPVGQGLTVSLAWPGGMVTGTAAVTDELAPKLFELAHDRIPGAARVSALRDPSVNMHYRQRLGTPSV
jgi:putative ABC transport system substrate-binding protein